MRRTIFATVYVFASVSTALSGTTDPMAAVRQYVDDFNKGDAKAMAVACASPASVIDGLPPHVWSGPTACEDWRRDVIAAGEREGATGYFIRLDEPWHVDVSGDRAYVVVPATMTFKVHGKQATQSGSIFTVALRQLPEGWRIAGWAWAKGTR